MFSVDSIDCTWVTAECLATRSCLPERAGNVDTNRFPSPFYLSGFKNDLKFNRHYLFDILMMF